MSSLGILKTRSFVATLRLSRNRGNLNIPVWGWAPCHGGRWGGYIWAEWSGPGHPRQTPAKPPGRGSDGRSSSRRLQEPERSATMKPLRFKLLHNWCCSHPASLPLLMWSLVHAHTIKTISSRPPANQDKGHSGLNFQLTSCYSQRLNRSKQALRSIPHRWLLTVRANMISLTFLFPTIRFFIALTESLGLGKNKTQTLHQMIKLFVWTWK